jgi:hypothetical protein
MRPRRCGMQVYRVDLFQSIPHCKEYLSCEFLRQNVVEANDENKS